MTVTEYIPFHILTPHSPLLVGTIHRCHILPFSIYLFSANTLLHLQYLLGIIATTSAILLTFTQWLCALPMESLALGFTPISVRPPFSSLALGSGIFPGGSGGDPPCPPMGADGQAKKAASGA